MIRNAKKVKIGIYITEKRFIYMLIAPLQDSGVFKKVKNHYIFDMPKHKSNKKMYIG